MFTTVQYELASDISCCFSHKRTVAKCMITHFRRHISKLCTSLYNLILYYYVHQTIIFKSDKTEMLNGFQALRPRKIRKGRSFYPIWGGSLSHYHEASLNLTCSARKRGPLSYFLILPGIIHCGYQRTISRSSLLQLHPQTPHMVNLVVVTIINYETFMATSNKNYC